MELLESLIPGIVALVVPAAEHALGADAPLDAKHAWIKDAVQDVLEHMILSKIAVPSWAAQLEGPIEDMISAELAKLSAKVEA